MTITQAKSEARKPYPLRFVEAQDRESATAFSARVPGFSFFFDKQHVLIMQLNVERDNQIASKDDIAGVALEVSFVDANEDAHLEGFDEAPGKSHYFIGKDPSQWKTGLSSFKRLKYASIWAGVDLEVGSCDEGLKLNWILDTPERVGTVRLRWSGAKALEIDEQGDLKVHHALGMLTDAAPKAWQVIDGQERPVACAYRLDGDEVSFILGNTDCKYPVIIDPIIGYSTYLGGSSVDQALDIVVDNVGCAYVTGVTYSSNFPTTPGAYQETPLSLPASAAFITKLSADGTEALFSSYLSASSGVVLGRGIDVDAAGNVYVVGSTLASDFPVTPGAFQTTYAGYTAGFVTKFAPDGASLIYSTFLLGVSGLNSEVFGITVDNQGFAYVTGDTDAPDFPTTPGVFQETYGGGASDAFVTKFNQDGTDVIFSTYLGGSDRDIGLSIKVNEGGRVYVCGHTRSPDFPVTPGAYQETIAGTAGSTYNGFITALTPDGSGLVLSTYLGGEGGTFCRDMALEASGIMAVCGWTEATDFPTTPDAYQTTLSGFNGAFVSRLSPDGAQLLTSTYIETNSGASSIAIDAQGYVYCSGFKNVNTAVVWLLNAGLSQLLAEATWGQSDLSEYLLCYLDLGPDGSYYVTGWDNGKGGITPTSDAFQTTYGGGTFDAFVVKSGFIVIGRASLMITGFLKRG